MLFFIQPKTPYLSKHSSYPKTGKASQTRKTYLQHMYMKRDTYLEHIKNSYNAVRKQPNRNEQMS